MEEKKRYKCGGCGKKGVVRYSKWERYDNAYGNLGHCEYCGKKQRISYIMETKRQRRRRARRSYKNHKAKRSTYAKKWANDNAERISQKRIEKLNASYEIKDVDENDSPTSVKEVNAYLVSQGVLNHKITGAKRGGAFHFTGKDAKNWTGIYVKKVSEMTYKEWLESYEDLSGMKVSA